MDYKLPQETGLYWGRCTHFKGDLPRWDLILEVTGKAPYFHIHAYVLTDGITHRRWSGVTRISVPPEEVVFGPCIPKPWIPETAPA